MRLKNTKNIVANLIVAMILISSVITLSSENINSNDNDEFNDIIATSYLENPLGEVTKKIWNKDSSSWVNTINAEFDETITFNISVKYIPLYSESLTVFDITVNDTLPDCLEYSNNAVLYYGDAEIPGESWISGKKIFWNLSEDPYDVSLWNLTKAGASIYVDSFYILYNATVIDCTDLDGEQNNVKVRGYETCPSYWVYGEDTATIIVDCTPPCDGDLTIEKYVKWDCTLPYKKIVDADIGDYVTFKLYVNTSDVIMDVSVRDELPDGLSYITDSSDITGITVPDAEPEIDSNNNFLYWNFTDVPANSHIIITFEANVDECGELINIANVTGEVACDIIYYDEDQAIVDVECPICEGDITIEKYVKWACDPNYEKYVEGVINDWITFKLYINTSDIIMDVSVRDELPDGLSYITDSSDITGITVADAEPEIDSNNNFLYWNFTDVTANSHIIITFRAEIDECGELINIANVTGKYDSDSISDEDFATVNVECPSPQMIIEKKVWNKTSIQWEEDIAAYIGDTVRFNITITNNGEDFLYNINITDELPSGLEYANNADPTESGISGNIIYWNLTEDYDVHLNKDEKYYIEFDAKVTDDGEQINIANITTNECSGIIIQDEDTAIVYVETTYGLICEKTVRAQDGTWVNEINANVGDTIRFNITVTYVGSVFIYNIWINDTLPDCLEYVTNSATPNEPFIEGNILLWHIDDRYIDPGETIYIEFNAVVISEGTCVNTINIKACECNECTLLTCSDTTIINVFSELEADASGSPIQIYEGESVTFTGSATGGTTPYTWSWDFDDGTSSNEQNPTHQFNNQGQYTVTLTVTDDNDNTDTDIVIITVNEEYTNTKPNKPNKPTGPSNGDKETAYSYSTSATDPDGDQLFYLWDWGDGTNSGWLGPNNSGTTVTASHSWDEGAYEIKVRVKDTDGLLSDWSDPLTISMPKYKLLNNILIRIINILIERFPIIEKILNQILL